jgi:hypothetical protein
MDDTIMRTKFWINGKIRSHNTFIYLDDTYQTSSYPFSASGWCFGKIKSNLLLLTCEVPCFIPDWSFYSH